MRPRKFRMAGWLWGGALSFFLLPGPSHAAYQNRVLTSANAGGLISGTTYDSHLSLGQNIVSSWNGVGGLQNLSGIMHFNGLYAWLVPVEEQPAGDLLPAEFMLHQNFPNPFNPSTTIRYDLPRLAHVVLELYNARGERVTALVDGLRQPGYHEVVWDAAGLASGIYFYRIHAGDFVQMHKLILLK